MSHTNGVYGTRAAIEAGVDSLEHGNYMDEETLSMLADSDTVWVPTLVTVRNLLGCGRYDDEVLRPIIVQVRRTWYVMAFAKKSKGSTRQRCRCLHGVHMEKESARNMKLFARFWEIYPGSDRMAAKMGKKKSGKDFVGNKIRENGNIT